jgi:arginine exporter protein ArgO
MMDLVDRVSSRATKTDESLERHLRLLRTVVLLIVLPIFILVAGVAVAVIYAGQHPMETLGIGLGGSGAFIVTAILALRRGVRDMLDRAVEAARDEALESRDEIAD